jgi:hypothetical protein
MGHKRLDDTDTSDETSNEVKPSKKRSSEIIDEVKPPKKGSSRETSKDIKLSKKRNSETFVQVKPSKKDFCTETIEDIKPKKRHSEAADEVKPPRKRSHEEIDNVKPSKKHRSEEFNEHETTSKPTEKIIDHAADFIEFINDLEMHAKDKLNKLTGYYDIAKLAASIPMLQKHHDLFSQPTFKKDFNALYTIACRRKHASLDKVVNMVKGYLNDGSSVESFPDFPKAPSRPIDAFIKENGRGATLQELGQKRREFGSENFDKQPYWDKYIKECKRYIKKMQRYLDEHSEKLRDDHVSCVNKLIEKYQKIIDEPQRQSFSRARKPKKEKKTAFEWFKDAHPDWYEGVEEEKRNRKLLKKFNKLDEEERSQFENIALILLILPRIFMQ